MLLRLPLERKVIQSSFRLYPVVNLNFVSLGRIPSVLSCLSLGAGRGGGHSCAPALPRALQPFLGTTSNVLTGQKAFPWLPSHWWACARKTDTAKIGLIVRIQIINFFSWIPNRIFKHHYKCKTQSELRAQVSICPTATRDT